MVPEKRPSSRFGKISIWHRDPLCACTSTNFPLIAPINFKAVSLMTALISSAHLTNALCAPVTNHNRRFLAYDDRYIYKRRRRLGPSPPNKIKEWSDGDYDDASVSKPGTIQFAGPMATGGGELLIKRSITPAETNYSKCPA